MTIRGVDGSYFFTRLDNGILGTQSSSCPGFQLRIASRLEIGHASGCPFLLYLHVDNSNERMLMWGYTKGGVGWCVCVCGGGGGGGGG